MGDTSIEKLHNYYNAAKNLEPAKRMDLKKIFELTPEDEKRLIGLKNEDEFAVIIHALEWVKSLSGIEEGIAQITGTKTTDLFVETIHGKKLSIEIKSSQHFEKNYAPKMIKDKIEFSEKHAHECYFAIKLAGHWMLLSGEYILNNNCKISLEKDYINSQMNDIFGERLFLFPKGMEIITTYSKSQNGICGIENTYGNAVRIAIKVNGKRKFLITSNNTTYVLLSIVLEALENAMSNQEQIVKRKDDDKTIVIERLTEDTFLTFSRILTAPILHTVNEKLGEQYSYQTYIEEMKKKDHNNLLTRKHVLDFLLLLFDNEYKIEMSLNNRDFYNLEDFIIK